MKKCRHEITLSHIYDVDMLRIKRMKVRDIELVRTGFVDLCGAVPYANRDMGMGKCIVSSPLLMFIEPQQQEEFATWLATSCYDRFLTFDLNNNDRFLHSGPKKVHIHHVLEALRMAEIDTVNIYVYGMKSNWLFSHHVPDTERKAGCLIPSFTSQ